MRQLVDERVTSALAPTSIVTAWLIEDEDLGPQGQPLGQRDLRWLPPERRLTRFSRSGGRTCRRSRYEVTMVFTAERSTMPARVIWCTTLIEMLSRTVISAKRPWRLRSSGT
jgi:hypothetical protein